jgi:hypothetical protein
MIAEFARLPDPYPSEGFYSQRRLAPAYRSQEEEAKAAWRE